MAMSSQVNPDLVSATRFGNENEVRDRRKPSGRAIPGDGSLAILADLHLSAILRIAAERIIEYSFGRPRMAPDESAVGLSRVAVLKRRGECSVSLRAAGEQDDSRCSDIETMDEKQSAIAA